MSIHETNLYTGTLQFREIDFSFAFDCHELRLIPPEEKKASILFDFNMTQISPGVYTASEPVPIEEVFLVGSCNETGTKIIFFPERWSYLSYYHFSLCIPLSAFILCKYDRDLIDRITFTGPEINHIHPVKSGVRLKITADYHENGIVTVSTEDFEATTTEKQYFDVGGKQVGVYFGIWRQIKLSNDEPPIDIRSTMMLEFEATNDFNFILELLRIAQTFISYLCYRNNICFSSIQIATPYKDGNHDNFANLIALNRYEQEEKKPIREDRCIKQYLVAGHEGKILSDIAKNALYVRHIPESYSSGRSIDVGRFILLVTAFEWEFARLFKEDEIDNDPVQQAAGKVVSLEFTDLIAKYKKAGVSKKDDSFNKEIRSIIHISQMHLSDRTLKDKVIYVGLKLHNIIDCFGEPFYTRAGIPFKYEDIGQRLGSQRNHFAHGDLDKKFIDHSLIDLVFLEYIIYAMQLKFYHIDEKNIKQAISDLFRRNIIVD